MTGLKKTALTAAIAAISAGANAELTLLDDATMSRVTGKAGLTIDIETKVRIEEFAYQDGGFILQQGMSIGGNNSAAETVFSGGHGYLDNLRLNVDVSGDGSSASNDNLFDYGFSGMADFAGIHTSNGNTDSGMLLAAGITTGLAQDQSTGLMIDTKRTYNDGDLVVHISPTDAWQKGGGYSAYSGSGGDNGSGGTATLSSLSYEAAVDIKRRAIDYNLGWDSVGLAGSDYDVGSSGIETYLNSTSGQLNGTNHSTGLDATPTTTSLLSGINVNGYFGPIDFHIENNGNGFGADGSSPDGLIGRGNSDSKINIDVFFDVTDYDVYIDIAGLQLSDIQIHNRRGDQGSMHRNATDTGYTSSFGMAHGQRYIYAVKDAVLNLNEIPGSQAGSNPNYFVDGIGHDTNFKGDVDIGAISFGDTGTSIGQIYITDYDFRTDWVISAH